MRFATTMTYRSAALGVGGFREPFLMGEDLDLLLRLGEAGKLGNVTRTLYFYRQHLQSVCASLGARWLAYRELILSLARERRELGSDRLQRGELVVLGPVAEAPDTKRVSHTYVHWARCALINGNRRLAWKYSRAAIVRHPFLMPAWRVLTRTALGMVPRRST